MPIIRTRSVARHASVAVTTSAWRRRAWITKHPNVNRAASATGTSTNDITSPPFEIPPKSGRPSDMRRAGAPRHGGFCCTATEGRAQTCLARNSQAAGNERHARRSHDAARMSVADFPCAAPCPSRSRSHQERDTAMGLLVDGVWRDQWYDTAATGGRFERKASAFRNWVTADGAPGPSGEGGFRAEPGRYHLYVSLACPWAHRTLIGRALKGLEAAVTVSVVDPHMGSEGWVFGDTPGATPDPIHDARRLYEVYLAADPA